MSHFLESLSLEQLFFYPLALFTVLGAIGVIVARSPLYSALSLVCSFFFIAATYILLAAHFVGILQLIVYAGAIMILFLFVIMLISIDDWDFGENPTLLKIIGSLFGVGILMAAVKVFGWGHAALAGAQVDRLKLDPRPFAADFGTVAAVGRLLFTEYLLPFEAVSALLLVSIVGAVVVSKGRL